jgi:hypothetical protein
MKAKRGHRTRRNEVKPCADPSGDAAPAELRAPQETPTVRWRPTFDHSSPRMLVGGKGGGGGCWRNQMLEELRFGRYICSIDNHTWSTVRRPPLSTATTNPPLPRPLSSGCRQCLLPTRPSEVGRGDLLTAVAHPARPGRRQRCARTQ